MDVIAVCPTRGVVYSETIESLRKNGINGFFTISGLGIPDAHNEAVRLALKEFSSYVLLVEDDMKIPEGMIEKMIKKDAAITCLDYPLDNGYSTVCRKGEEILWCGLGCILIKRKVLEVMGDPWFTTDYSWKIVSENPFEIERIENPSKYGGHDINFCIRARELGYKIECVGEAQHLRSPNIVRNQENNGKFTVEPLPEIKYRQNYL